MKARTFLLTGLLFISLPAFLFLPSFADEIILLNNDRISGELTRAENGLVTVKTGYSDPVVIQQGSIRALSTEKPVTLLLESGEVLKGRVSTADDGKFYLEPTPQREVVALNWMSVKAINPPPSKWKGNIAIGGSVESGNTERSSLSMGVETSRKTEKDRFGIRFFFNYAEENDILSTRNTYGSLKYDYFFYTSFYGYLGVEMLKDKFKDLNLRTVTGSGAGYQIWDDKIKSLSFETGLTFFSEDLKKGEDSNRAAGRLNTSFAWTIASAVTLSEQATWYPSLESSQYLFRNEAGLSIPAGSGWNFGINNIYEHNSNPPAGIRKNDLQWILALQYAF